MKLGMAATPFEGYTLYKVYHRRQGRWYAQLVRNKTNRTTMSFARYLMCVKLGRVLEKHETVDHIDNDKTNDWIENLQLLPLVENIRKAAKPAQMKSLNCAHCGVEFNIPKRNAKFRRGYCSPLCAHQAQVKPRVTVECVYCQSPISMTQRQLEVRKEKSDSTGAVCCSQWCARKYQGLHLRGSFHVSRGSSGRFRASGS